MHLKIPQHTIYRIFSRISPNGFAGECLGEGDGEGKGEGEGEGDDEGEGEAELGGDCLDAFGWIIGSDCDGCNAFSGGDNNTSDNESREIESSESGEEGEGALEGEICMGGAEVSSIAEFELLLRSNDLREATFGELLGDSFAGGEEYFGVKELVELEFKEFLEPVIIRSGAGEEAGDLAAAAVTSLSEDSRL